MFIAQSPTGISGYPVRVKPLIEFNKSIYTNGGVSSTANVPVGNWGQLTFSIVSDVNRDGDQEIFQIEWIDGPTRQSVKWIDTVTYEDDFNTIPVNTLASIQVNPSPITAKAMTSQTGELDRSRLATMDARYLGCYSFNNNLDIIVCLVRVSGNETALVVYPSKLTHYVGHDDYGITGPEYQDIESLGFTHTNDLILPYLIYPSDESVEDRQHWFCNVDYDSYFVFIGVTPDFWFDVSQEELNSSFNLSTTGLQSSKQEYLTI